MSKCFTKPTQKLFSFNPRGTFKTEISLIIIIITMGNIYKEGNNSTKEKQLSFTLASDFVHDSSHF